MTASVLLEKPEKGIGLITLNRPGSRNAMNLAFMEEFRVLMEQIATDPDINVLIMTGSGKAFCAGLDLKEMVESGPFISDGKNKTSVPAFIRMLREYEQPIIGAINGPAITGGFELALTCDILIASEEASFADTHCRVGILPGWGLSQKLPRIIGAGRAKELSLSCSFLSARQAESWGLVNKVTPSHELLPEAMRLARDIAANQVYMVREYKKLIDQGLTMPLPEAMAMEFEKSNQHIDNVTADILSGRLQGIFDLGRESSKRL